MQQRSNPTARYWQYSCFYFRHTHFEHSPCAYLVNQAFFSFSVSVMAMRIVMV